MFLHQRETESSEIGIVTVIYKLYFSFLPFFGWTVNKYSYRRGGTIARVAKRFIINFSLLTIFLCVEMYGSSDFFCVFFFKEGPIICCPCLAWPLSRTRPPCASSAARSGGPSRSSTCIPSGKVGSLFLYIYILVFKCLLTMFSTSCGRCLRTVLTAWKTSTSPCWMTCSMQAFAAQ